MLFSLSLRETHVPPYYRSGDRCFGYSNTTDHLIAWPRFSKQANSLVLAQYRSVEANLPIMCEPSCGLLSNERQINKVDGWGSIKLDIDRSVKAELTNPRFYYIIQVVIDLVTFVQRNSFLLAIL